MKLEHTGALDPMFGVTRIQPMDHSRFNYVPPNWELLRYVPADLRLTWDEMLSLSTVYAAVRAIVDPLARAKWVPVVRDGNTRQNLPDSNLYFLLNREPNGEDNAQAAKEVLITQAIIHGNGYALIDRDPLNRVIGWVPLNSDAITPWRDPETGKKWLAYRQADGTYIPLDPADVIQLQGPQSVYGLLGDSLLYRASKAIALAVAQERFAMTYFTNGAAIGGYLKFANVVKDEGVRNRLKESWGSEYGGVRNAHKIPVLEGGEFVQLSPDAEKAQIIESRQASVHEVSRYFNVPLVLLQEPQASQGFGTHTQQFYEMYIRTCLSIWAGRIEQATSKALLPKRAPWPEIEVDLAWLTRGNAMERAQTNQILINSGQLTPNEARADEGRDSMEGGDVLLIGSGLTTLDRVVNPPEPPPALAPAPAADVNPDAADEGPEEDAQDPQEAKEPPEQDNAEALAGLLTLALERHGRRVTNRTAAGRTPAPDHGELAANECRDLIGLAGRTPSDQAIRTAVESVSAGIEPRKAAAHLLTQIGA
jgi:HK97 family phage portal protein